MFIIYIISIVTTFLLGVHCGACTMRNDAVNNNAAEFYLDENHKRRWRWKK